MASAKRFRWVCPECGKGALGSSRPRKLATVRFCLACSAKSATLVERTCPALDKKRAAGQAQTRKKAKRKATRARDQERTRFVYRQGSREFDLRREARKLWRAMDMKGRRALPRMEIRHRKVSQYTTGRSYRGRIVLTLYRDCPAPDALTLLAHELAHEAAPYGEAHGPRWRSLFACSVESVYGAGIEQAGSNYHGLHGAIAAALEKKMKEATT